MKHELSSGRPVFNRRSVNSALSAMAVTGLLAGCDRAQASPVSSATLVGIWKGEERGPLGTMSVEVIFFRNDTYRRSHRWGELMTFDSGSYTVVENWIHFKLQDYGPRTYKGQAMSRPMSDTWVVGRFDGQSLAATVGGNSRISIRRQ